MFGGAKTARPLGGGFSAPMQKDQYGDAVRAAAKPYAAYAPPQASGQQDVAPAAQPAVAPPTSQSPVRATTEFGDEFQRWSGISKDRLDQITAGGNAVAVNPLRRQQERLAALRKGRQAPVHNPGPKEQQLARREAELISNWGRLSPAQRTAYANQAPSGGSLRGDWRGDLVAAAEKERFEKSPEGKAELARRGEEMRQAAAAAELRNVESARQEKADREAGAGAFRDSREKWYSTAGENSGMVREYDKNAYDMYELEKQIKSARDSLWSKNNSASPLLRQGDEYDRAWYSEVGPLSSRLDELRKRQSQISRNLSAAGVDFGGVHPSQLWMVFGGQSPS